MKKSTEISLSQILSKNVSQMVERRTVLRLSMFGLIGILVPKFLGNIPRKNKEIIIVDGWIIALDDLNRLGSARRRS